MERYCKESRCFKCGEPCHNYRACSTRIAKKENPQESIILSEEKHEKEESRLCYARGKVRDHDSFILFNLGSTHNFISTELTAKLGIHVHEMGLALDVEGTFVRQNVPVTPLIGKLCLHVQGFVL